MATKTIEGGCHCGAVRYRAEADLGSTLECNCSHCQAKGFILTFTPADSFELLSGEDKLTEYRFNTHKIAHLFCSVCGTQPFARGAMPDGTPMASINVRSIDDIDLDALEPQKHDGRNA
jgi:hypothetical protein